MRLKIINPERKTTMNLFKSLFSGVNVQKLKREELKVAQISLLKARTELDWANACVTYNQARVERLTKDLADTEALSEAARLAAPAKEPRVAGASPLFAAPYGKDPILTP